MKTKLINFLKENLKFELDYDKLLEKPKIAQNGDFSLPCFLIAKQLSKNPALVSKELADNLNKDIPEFLEKIESIGPFLNFYFNTILESKQVINSIYDNSLFFFENLNPQKILIEYPSPNTNKALHIGHVRNMLIGNSLGKILKKTENKVIRTNLNNDRGIALCKSMLGFELFFKNETPKSLNLKSDEFVSKCYVEFESKAKKDDNLNIKAQEMLVKWEAGDNEVRKLWQEILNLVFSGYKETYLNYKLLKFDKEYFESEIYDKGKEIIIKALKNNVKGFGKENDGAVFCDLTDIGFDKKYLLRSDGTTLYMTQDLYLANLKEKDFNADKYIFIVGKEQEYHFNVLFEILDRLGFGGGNKNFHFAYGYVYDENGEKFSSRKGKVIGADWLLNEIVIKAKKNLLTKEISKNLSEDELNQRANIIGYSALAFSMLKVNPIDDMKFDLDKALAFEGETGPYIQYTYARIQSILRKAQIDFKFDLSNNLKNIDYSLFEDREKNLIKLLKEYPQVVMEASSKYKISAIANYLIKICKSFNDFYQNCPILNSDDLIRNARLVLADSTAKVIKDGLELLDIEVLDEM